MTMAFISLLRVKHIGTRGDALREKDRSEEARFDVNDIQTKHGMFLHLNARAKVSEFSKAWHRFLPATGIS